MSSVRAAIAAPQCRWLRYGTGEGDQRCTETVTPMQLQFETRSVAHENAHTHILHTDNRYIHVPSTNLASDLCIVRFDWARMQFGNESITGEYWNTQQQKKRLHRNTHTNGVYLRTHTLAHGARRTNCSENADTKNLNSNLIDCRRKQINLYRCATYHSTPRQYGLVIRSIQLTLGFICCPCSSRSLSIWWWWI